MKKTIASVWFFATIFFLLTPSSSQAIEFAGGTGEPVDPYQIATAEQLIGLGEDPNLYDKHFVLVADIDLDPNLPGGRVFKGAVISDANGAYPFNGQFDGNHHTISNLVIRGGEKYGGLLGTTGEKALIQYLSLKNVSVHGITPPYRDERTRSEDWIQTVFAYVGSLVGSNRGIIRNCKVSGHMSDCYIVGGLAGINSGIINGCRSSVNFGGYCSVAGAMVGRNLGSIILCESLGSPEPNEVYPELISYDIDGRVIGGLVGENRGTISHSSSNYRVTGKECVGGLVGYNNGGTLISCHFSGAINNLNWGVCDVGGLIGYSHSGCIRSCYNKGRIHYQYGEYYQSYAGGLIGRSVDDCINSCYNNGAIVTAIVVYTGGLVGRNDGSIIMFSYNMGWVDVRTGGKAAGGLVGLNRGVIQSSYHNGLVYDKPSAHSSYVIGGLVGDNKGAIQRCYSIGIVQGEEVRISGGLVGINSGHVLQCYSVGIVNGYKATGGLVGVNSQHGLIADCFSATKVASGTSWGDRSGGLVGFDYKHSSDDNSTILSSFWDVDISRLEISSGGTGLTSTQMRTRATFLDAGWDFKGERENGYDDIWQHHDWSYPTLVGLFKEVPVALQGTGTQDDPYLIGDVNGLHMMSFHPWAHFRLVADLDVMERTWNAAVVPWFGGNFNGDGHLINSLSIQGGGNLGLFGILTDGAKVSRVGLNDVLVKGVGDFVGGMAAYNEGSIELCFTKGIIQGRDSVGGLVGCQELPFYRYGNGVHHCYSHAKVVGRRYVGGLVGSGHYSVIGKSYSTGMVVGDYAVGGVLGYEGQESYSSGLWDIETSGQIESAGSSWGGRTTNEMQDINTYLGSRWDFENIWMICEGDYPRLQWENIQCDGMTVGP